VDGLVVELREDDCAGDQNRRNVTAATAAPEAIISAWRRSTATTTERRDSAPG
jgi:hypothetical protein